MSGQGEGGGGGRQKSQNSGIIGRKHEYQGVSKVIKKMVNKRKLF